MATEHNRRRRKSLLRSFDKTARLARPGLVSRYGASFADTLYREVREEYDRLIPEIPHIKGARARALNTFLRVTAQEIAVYKVMKRHGRSAGEAWEVCHDAITARMQRYPAWKIWLLKTIMFSRLLERIVRRRAEKKEQLRFGDFEVRYLIGDGEDWDWGVDYVECGNYNLVKSQGVEEFAPYVCLSDMALGEALGWGLRRTETLADGCGRCDFRFTKGAGTHISSKTPEVQDTIERIEKR